MGVRTPKLKKKSEIKEVDETLYKYNRDLEVDEIEIIYKFIHSGDMTGSYNEVRRRPNGLPYSYDRVYAFFNAKIVRDKIIEIGQSLSVYDTVCDRTLLKIITNPNESSKNVISAIKEWNNLRQRTFTAIQINDIKNFDFNNLNDKNVENLLNILGEEDNNE